MATIQFRVHFKNGLSLDCEQETTLLGYDEVWGKIIKLLENGRGNHWYSTDMPNDKCAMFKLEEVIAFERL